MENDSCRRYRSSAGMLSRCILSFLLFPAVIYASGHIDDSDRNEAAWSSATSSALEWFLDPVNGYVIAGASNISASTYSALAVVEDCAKACLANENCVSFNWHEASSAAGANGCTLNGYSADYSVIEQQNSSYYHRIQLRKDVPSSQAVPYRAAVPIANVTLSPGSLLRRTFDANIQYLLQHPVDDLLFFFRQRAGVPNPPDAACWGWDVMFRGSVAGEFLMGAGGAIRWSNSTNLEANVKAVVDGIKTLQQHDGFMMAFPQEETFYAQNPDYVTSWITHGLLEVAISGNPDALQMLRRHANWFNNCTYLPLFLPPDDRPTSPHTSGAAFGHGIASIYQGMIHNTRLALSPVGTVADMEVVANLYQENWWLRQLSARNLSAVWRRTWFPHNYELTALEAYMDMYLLTANHTYLDAVQGGWDMFKAHWIHLGGSMAINEPWAVEYPPGSYYLDFNSTEWEGTRLKYGDVPACQGPIFEAGSRQRWSKHLDSPFVGHATGELCGSVFWIKLTQRMQQLQPANETLAWEIERQIFNVAVANQEPRGRGIRYFAVLHKNKQTPTNKGTCCEGQGTRLFGSLPEYVFSFNASESVVYVHLMTSAQGIFALGGGTIQVQLESDFPTAPSVGSRLNVVCISPSKVSGACNFTLMLRIPSWTSGTVTIASTTTGKPIAFGVPGSYLHLPAASFTGEPLKFSLPMPLTLHRYTGATTRPEGPRYALQIGPILLAFVAPYNSHDSVLAINASGWNVTNTSAWLTSEACPEDVTAAMLPEGDTLHLGCDTGVIESLSFVSYGNPTGTCGNYTQGACHSDSATDIVKRECTGRPSCDIVISNDMLGGDPCPGVKKRLAATGLGCIKAQQPSAMLYRVQDNPEYVVKPYYAVQNETFDVYPVFTNP